MILIVNTAEEALQLVLAQEGRILEKMTQVCQGRMNEIMAPAVSDMLVRHTAPLAACACVRGPGSFTGVRLGLAFCLGLCLTRDIPMAGLDYLPLLAASAPPGASRIHVVTHSRRNQVYHQSFTPDGSSQPQDLDTPDARALIAADSAAAPVTILGSGIKRNPDAFSHIPGATLLDLDTPTPKALLDAALAAAYDGLPIDALYLRGSDAEENLAMIAAKRGLSEEEARARMRKAMS